MSKISIVDLEVFYHVGVPDAERAQPQRLLLTVEMESDFTAAAKSDSIADTIDYFAVSQRLLKFGDGKSWKLIEKLAADAMDFRGLFCAARVSRPAMYASATSRYRGSPNSNVMLTLIASPMGCWMAGNPSIVAGIRR